MRSPLCVPLLTVTVIMIGATERQRSGRATQPIHFAIHDGYFVSNQFEPNAPTSVLVLKGQKAFDEVFGSAYVMHDNHHRLPPDAFKTKMIVAVIHRGKATWEYTVESVTVDGKTLIVQYATQSTPNQCAAWPCFVPAACAPTFPHGAAVPT